MRISINQPLLKQSELELMETTISTQDSDNEQHESQLVSVEHLRENWQEIDSRETQISGHEVTYYNWIMHT